MAKRSVRSMLVVIDPPSFELFPRIIDRSERMDVETFIRASDR
jgi:hypothetical protein